MPKRAHPGNDENDPFAAVYTPDKPPAKRHRRSGLPNTNNADFQAELARAQEERRLKEKEGQTCREAEAEQEEIRELRERLQHVRTDGYSLPKFFSDLFATKDPHISSEVTKLVQNHGIDLFEAMRARSPDVALQWFNKTMEAAITSEARHLAEELRPAEHVQLSSILKDWSLSDVLAKGEQVAPTLLGVLRLASTHDKQGQKRRDRDLILATILCLVAQAYSERSNETQTVMGIYLFACGASRSQFAVLHHAGLTASYTKALADIRTLRDEQLKKIIRIAKTRAFMLVWDNLNFAFRVGEQRLKSKDHFDSGTTATLIPLYDVGFGELPLSSLKPRRTRLNVLDFSAADLLPPTDSIRQLEDAMLWHIEDMLLDTYPALRARFEDIPSVPTVRAAPVHQTEQHPLPAMPTDESSIDGTLEVIETLLQKVLQLSEDDIQKHGVIICAGDQLTNSLVDKASACRRDDKSLLDNPSRYALPQPGLFHIKLAAMRMVANEHWGPVNSNAPWSLWRMNTLLARKAISVGWKAKKLTPFRPTLELVSKLVLPANILDAFRLESRSPLTTNHSLDAWVENVNEYAAIQAVATKVRDRLCSSKRIQTLCRLPEHLRDHTLENIILFNRDTLILREFFHAIKRGDIGSVINVLWFWLHQFRGTGMMPKYSDALFEVLMTLKSMEPRLRHAYEVNWLVNLSGRANAFKEVDLLQEHQNFWAKVIYLPQGSNRSWAFISMVSVLIFVLRDVIRNVQTSFKTPYNGKSHSSPATTEEIKILREYLERHSIQSYYREREGGDSAVPVRDLFLEGTKYMHMASAFKNFRQVTSRATHRYDADTQEDAEEQADEEEHAENGFEEADIDTATMDDLLIDEEEFDPDTDLMETITQMRELVHGIMEY